jgi:uroporphyrinogen decarboxylase
MAIHRPIWLMRQAGRYLPEYRALRAQKGGFLALVYDAEAAAEITLQPIRRFGLDGAILFSDILIVPYAMGQDLEFLVGEGPHLSPARRYGARPASTPCRSALRRSTKRSSQGARRSLPADKTMLGFAGSPWTVATYMVAGRGQPRPARDARHGLSRSAGLSRRSSMPSYRHGRLSGRPGAWPGRRRCSCSIQLGRQPCPGEFERWVIAPNAAIVAALKARFPELPVIGFPKGAGEKLPAYARETGVHAVGMDETIDPLWAARELPAGMPVQGNLDPLLLLAGGDEMERRTLRILDAFADRPHVFNLGHGIGQFTPIEHVEQLLGRGARLEPIRPMIPEWNGQRLETPLMRAGLAMTISGSRPAT